MSNPFSLFMNLLPKQVKYLAKIVAVYSDGTATVQRINGTTTNLVKGGSDSYVEDDYVFIVDGLITSKVSNVQPTVIAEIQDGTA